MGPATSPAVLHRKLCALVTAGSCLFHVWLAAAGSHGTWVSLLMLALAAICVPCTVHIWRHGGVEALHRVTLSALAMVALHAALLLGAGGGRHAHGAVPPLGVADTSAAAQLLVVMALEFATAMLAATLVARLRRHLGTA